MSRGAPRTVAAVVSVVLSILTPLAAPVAGACSQPTTSSVDAGFELAANRTLPARYPQIASDSTVRAIPPSVLKAVGWVESGWRQYARHDRPLLSQDFGYGIMQITSGMAGAFGNVRGDIDPSVQSRIASDYIFNIAYGARVLAQKWANVPTIGNGDPSVVENWYYALWAYNGWGWVNNPNNPRFSRKGTPATNPANFPYQERVLYLVAHPPKDSDGNPLWQPVPVSLPSRTQIGSHPAALPVLPHGHRQPPATLSAVYSPTSMRPLTASSSQRVSVHIVNTGLKAWSTSGANSVRLTYHLFSLSGNPWRTFSPVTPGVVAFGQGSAPLARPLVPGQGASVTTTVRAPSTPGNYRVAWDLSLGGTTWFSQTGVLPHAQGLRVVSVGAAIPSASPTPTADVSPSEGLRYLADTSVPDGTIMVPRQAFDKGWLVYNNGQKPWSSGWNLRLVSGSSFGQKTISMSSTSRCRTANVIVHLRAPGSAGRYVGAWRLYDNRGVATGDRLTVVVVVRSQQPHPTPTRTPAPKPTATPTPTPVG